MPPASAPACTTGWYDEKYGRKKRGDKQWVKSHRMIATRTLSVVSAAVSEGTVHDTNLFPELLETTAKVFTVEEIAADKGYISHRNLKLVDDLGAIPYIPFKKNYLVPLNVTNSIWNRMVRLYVYQRDEFDAHYTTPRNKVEGSISVDKRVGGPNLSASTRPGQFNESFCRLIAYNLARLVRVHYTSQDLIDVVDFGQLEPRLLQFRTADTSFLSTRQRPPSASPLHSAPAQSARAQ